MMPIDIIKDVAIVWQAPSDPNNQTQLLANLQSAGLGASSKPELGLSTTEITNTQKITLFDHDGNPIQTPLGLNIATGVPWAIDTMSVEFADKLGALIGSQGHVVQPTTPSYNWGTRPSLATGITRGHQSSAWHCTAPDLESTDQIPKIRLPEEFFTSANAPDGYDLPADYKTIEIAGIERNQLADTGVPNLSWLVEHPELIEQMMNFIRNHEQDTLAQMQKSSVRVSVNAEGEKIVAQFCNELLWDTSHMLYWNDPYEHTYGTDLIFRHLLSVAFLNQMAEDYDIKIITGNYAGNQFTLDQFTIDSYKYIRAFFDELNHRIINEPEKYHMFAGMHFEIPSYYGAHIYTETTEHAYRQLYTSVQYNVNRSIEEGTSLYDKDGNIVTFITITETDLTRGAKEPILDLLRNGLEILDKNGNPIKVRFILAYVVTFYQTGQVSVEQYEETFLSGAWGSGGEGFFWGGYQGELIPIKPFINGDKVFHMLPNGKLVSLEEVAIAGCFAFKDSPIDRYSLYQIMNGVAHAPNTPTTWLQNCDGTITPNGENFFDFITQATAAMTYHWGTEIAENHPYHVRLPIIIDSDGITYTEPALNSGVSHLGHAKPKNLREGAHNRVKLPNIIQSKKISRTNSRGVHRRSRKK